MKRITLIYVSVFILSAAAPIALNGGSAPFIGGAISTQILAPDGTDAAPAYSHDTETGNGVWRSAANTLGLGAEVAHRLSFTGTSDRGSLAWSGFADASSTASAPAIRGTDSDTGIIAQSRAMDFVQNGTAFAGLRSDGAGSYRGGVCLRASSTGPCLNVHQTSSGKMVFNTANNGNYTGVFDLGDDGSLKTTRECGTPGGYAFASDNNTGLGVATAISFCGNGSQRAVIQSTGITTGQYMYVSSVAGDAPTQASDDCNADAERGRMLLDTTNSRLYICDGATRGWDYITLTDAPGI